MPLLKSTLVAGVASALVLGFAGPASASRDTGFDDSRDAPAGFDVTKVNFRLTSDRAYAKVHVRNLRQRGEFVFAVSNRSRTVRFGMSATGRADAPTVKKFYKFRNGQVSRKRCIGTKVGWHPRRDVVTMSFPARCFRALPQRIVLAVGSTRNFPNGSTVDEGPRVVLRP
ncbi:MAG TPA: hypothetical protein VEX15_17325 [Nocardioidaceae bacterium]|nr:hypothetical protein [Nocardioidaceae bacterium]